VILSIDDTIERRRGKRITAKGIYRDPARSSDAHFVKASGLRWVSLMLLAPIPWAQMGMEDGLDQVLEPYPLAHQLGSPGDLTPKRQCLLIWYPYLWQKAGGVELCQDGRINRIGLDFGVRNQPYLLGIGDNDTLDVRRQQFSQRGRIAGGLDHHMFVMGEFLLGERQ
jgi:hypothetical protein